MPIKRWDKGTPTKINNMKKLLQIALPLLAAAGLLWWVLKDLPWPEVNAALAQANWGLVLLSLLPTLVAHLARAQRWRLMLAPVAPTPTLAESFAAVMAGYVANLALPRAGEVVRCTLLARRRGIAVEVSLGTVIAERAFDVVLLLAITALAFLLQFDLLLQFFMRLIGAKAGTGQPASGGNGGLLMLAAGLGLGLLLLAYSLRTHLARLPLYGKIAEALQGLVTGLLSALKLRQRGQFLVLTVLIWACYYLSGWICLEALPGLRGIGPLAGLMIFTVGSYGMVAPVQGGYGPFEFMIIAGLTQIYGYAESLSAASALLMHNSQTAFAVVLGAPLLAWLAFGRRHRVAQTQQANT